MAINASVQRDSDGAWIFTWPVGTAPYSIWLDGKLIADGLTTEEFEISTAIYADTPPPLEILNDGDTPQNQTFPPYAVIQWRGLQAAGGYAIEEFQGGSGGSWVEISQRMEEGTGYYTWESDPLDDDTEHQFRVIAISPDGQDGTPVEFTMEMVRNPAPPDVTCSFNTAGDVVIS